MVNLDRAADFWRQFGTRSCFSRVSSSRAFLTSLRSSAQLRLRAGRNGVDSRFLINSRFNPDGPSTYLSKRAWKIATRHCWRVCRR